MPRPRGAGFLEAAAPYGKATARRVRAGSTVANFEHASSGLCCPKRAARHARVTRLVVWYDGACPLCRREIALMIRLDRLRAIDFVDVADTLPRDCPTDRQTLLARFHAQEDGQLLSGAAAFAAMWRAIPVLSRLGSWARNRVLLAMLEKLYAGFLVIRPLLQRFALRLDRR